MDDANLTEPLRDPRKIPAPTRLMILGGNMEPKRLNFNKATVRYYAFGEADRDLLLDTADVCKILGISQRPEGSDLASKYIDLQSASVYAMQGGNIEFYEWLGESFAGYSLEVLVRPQD